MIVETSTLRSALPHHDIGDELGHGRFGAVVAARHRSLHRDDAIRFLTNPGNAAAAVSLDHPHLVRVYSCVETDGQRILVTERLRGGTLRSRAAPSLATCCAVGLALAAGLAHAHDRGVVHGDLRLSDVLFAADGTPKLANVGLAEPGGTPADDVRALACLLYELLTGRSPVDTVDTADTAGAAGAPLTGPAAELPGVPAGIASVVQRGMAAEHAHGPAAARAFALELAAAAARAVEPGWLDGTAGAQVFLEPPIRAVATDHPGGRAAEPPEPAEPAEPRLDAGTLTADSRNDPTSELWIQPPQRRRRRGLVVVLAATAIAALAAAATLVAPRLVAQPGPAAMRAQGPAPGSVPAPPPGRTSASSSVPSSASSPNESAAALGPRFTAVAQPGTVTSLSADGARLVLVGADRVVTTYDVGTGKAIDRVDAPPVAGRATDVAFSPDATVVAFATTTSLVVGGRDLTGPAGLASTTFGGVEFLDGGTSVVVVDAVRLAVFDTASGTLVHDLARGPTTGPVPGGTGGTGATGQPGETVADVVADPSGRLLAVVTPGTVEFWDRATAARVAVVPVGEARRFATTATAWRSDGTLLTCLVSGGGRTARYQPVVVDPAGTVPVPVAVPSATGPDSTGPDATEPDATALGQCASFDAAGTRLAARVEPASGDVVVWDLAAGTELTRVYVAGEVSAALLSGDGRTLAVAAGGDVQIWTLPTTDGTHDGGDGR